MGALKVWQLAETARVELEQRRDALELRAANREFTDAEALADECHDWANTLFVEAVWIAENRSISPRARSTGCVPRLEAMKAWLDLSDELLTAPTPTLLDRARTMLNEGWSRSEARLTYFAATPDAFHELPLLEHLRPTTLVQCARTYRSLRRRAEPVRKDGARPTVSPGRLARARSPRPPRRSTPTNTRAPDRPRLSPFGLARDDGSETS